MSSPYAPYVPYDYPRCCDLCGNVRRISTMRRQGQYTVCDDHPGERTAFELSKAIARQKPFRILPAPNSKPQDRTGPDVLEVDEGRTLNFVAQQVAAGFQYQDIASGPGAAINSAAAVVGVLGWAARYCYDLLVEGKRSTEMLTQAKAVLRSAADQLVAKQRGFGNTPSATKSTDPQWGAIISGTGNLVCADQAMAGLALLYAYRLLPDTTTTQRMSYLVSSRATATFLRNVQAIGQVGITVFPSKDPAGTIRLYTGAVNDTMSTLGSFDGTAPFSPSGLLSFEFWSALRDTDGDQQIGSDAAIAGVFSSAPQQLLSQSITDIRAFWATGAYDVVRLDTRTGLSATTPSEKFNPYPMGTGSWEYFDGDANSGTMVSAANFGAALLALYRTEGASSQVTSIDDWLYTFASNSAFETPAGTSDSTLARSQTGTFDPSIAPTTLLLVRDANNGLAATAKNASKLYDWGAMGMMAPIRASRHASTFKTARLTPLGKKLRYADGLPSDYTYDAITLRGRSGLSYQTSFQENILNVARMVNDGVAAAQFGSVYRQQPQAMPVSV